MDDQVDDLADGHPESEDHDRRHAGEHGQGGPPERPRQREARRAGTDACAPALAARRALAQQQDRPEHDKDEREGTARGGVEADRELGVRLGGQCAEAEDLEGAELGQADEGDEHAAAEDGQSGLADGDLPERPQASEAEAAGHLFLCRVGVAQVGGDREEDERVHGEGHDQDGGPEAGEGREDGLPPEADDEVRDPERDDDQHRPHAPARQRGALDEPGQQRADHRAQHGDDDGQGDRVADQLGGQAAEEQRLQGRPPGLEGLDEQEDQRGEDRDGDEGGQREKGRGGRSKMSPQVVVVEVVPQPGPSAVPVPFVTVSVRPVPPTPVVLVAVPFAVPRRASPRAPRLAFLPGHVEERPPCSSHRGRRSQELRLLQQLDGLGTGAQLGDGDAVGLQLVERGLWLRGGHPRGDGVLEAVAVGDDLLPLRRGEERDAGAAPRPGAARTSGCRRPRRRRRSRRRAGRSRRWPSACWTRPPRPARGTSSTG